MRVQGAVRGKGCGMQSTERLGGPGPMEEGRGSHPLELEFQAVVSLYVKIFKAIYIYIQFNHVSICLQTF